MISNYEDDGFSEGSLNCPSASKALELLSDDDVAAGRRKLTVQEIVGVLLAFARMSQADSQFLTTHPIAREEEGAAHEARFYAGMARAMLSAAKQLRRLSLEVNRGN